MTSSLETTVIAVIAIVIFYVLLGSILTFTWNRSVAKIFNTTTQLDIVEALFLLVTMNILFGTFSQGALTTYHNYSNKITSGMN
jgi:uncharacterized membrane protein